MAAADLDHVRLADDGRPADLDEHEVRMAVRGAAVTANTTTYAALAAPLGYDRVDPGPGPWVRVPSWGWADVVASRHADVAVGTRLYGLWPLAHNAVLRPGRVTSSRVVDASTHRAGLAPAYQSYDRVPAPPGGPDDEDLARRCVLEPVTTLSFVLHALLSADHADVDQVVVTSASSKAGLGLLRLLAASPLRSRVVALTGHPEAVARTGVQVTVATSPERMSAPDGPVVVVDLAGDTRTRADVTRCLDGSSYRWLAAGTARAPMAGTPPDDLVFAPTLMNRFAGEWGREVFLQRWRAATEELHAWSRSWLELEEVDGLEALPDAWARVRAGAVPADRALVVRP